MSDAPTTKLSSRGQVVIPEEIRNRLGLEAGARFVVVAEGDTVILKRIRPPSLDEFDALIERARSAAADAGLTEEAIEEAVRRVRDER